MILLEPLLIFSDDFLCRVDKRRERLQPLLPSQRIRPPSDRDPLLYNLDLVFVVRPKFPFDFSGREIPERVLVDTRERSNV